MKDTMTTVCLVELSLPGICDGKIEFQWNADMKDSFVWLKSNIPRDVWGATRYDGKRKVYHLVTTSREVMSSRDAREVWANLVEEGWTLRVEEDAPV